MEKGDKYSIMSGLEEASQLGYVPTRFGVQAKEGELTSSGRTYAAEN